MTMAEMVQQMIEAGASPAVIAIAINGYEAASASVRRLSADIPDNAADKRRKNDRERKRLKRLEAKKLKGMLEANDASNAPPEIADNAADVSADSGLSRCSSSFLPLKEALQGKEEKVSGSARARGTRLPEDWYPTEADIHFAHDHGVDPGKLRDEFVDYWRGVPGQRGCKLDWSATWRNRVRDVAGRNNRFNGGQNGAGNRKDEWGSVQQQAGIFGRSINRERDGVS